MSKQAEGDQRIERIVRALRAHQRTSEIGAHLPIQECSGSQIGVGEPLPRCPPQLERLLARIDAVEPELERPVRALFLEVRVIVDEPGHDGAAAQVDAARGRTRQAIHLLVGADRHDPVATDGHRLAMADGEVGKIGDLLASRKILVPKKGILEIRKLAESGPGSIELSASEKFLFAAKGDTEVWVRLLDADFPDYRQVVPKENLLTATVARDAFAEVLRRVAVMAPDKVHSVKLSFSGKQLEVSSISPDQGEARDLLEAEYEGPAMKIGFNGRYLQDAVAGVSEEKMVLQLKDEVSQVILRPEKEHSYLAIVMPMRIY